MTSISITAIVLMLTTLLWAPFSHVHAGDPHQGADRAHGYQLHSHLPSSRHVTEDTEGPSVESLPHSGVAVDLFLSVSADAFPVAEGVDSSPDLQPPVRSVGRRGSRLRDRTRAPPDSDRSSRAPPHSAHA